MKKYLLPLVLVGVGLAATTGIGTSLINNIDRKLGVRSLEQRIVANIDELKTGRTKVAERKYEEVGRELEARQETVPDFDAALDDPVGDDLLRLVFTACHPVLPREGRVALTLRMLGGLTTEEIARAFLETPERSISRTIRDASLHATGSKRAESTSHSASAIRFAAFSLG